jgi:hypothetical protein
MRKQSQIKLLAYRGRTDQPESITITFQGATSLDDEAFEYWRMAVVKFYGNARVTLKNDGVSRKQTGTTR